MSAADYLAELEPRRWALVVGNASYTRLGPLPGALIDASQMEVRLQDLGFLVTRCTDVATVAQFEDDVLPAFRRQVRAGDLVLFYFSGHGFSHGPDSYLAVTGMDLRIAARDLGEVAIAVEALATYLSRPAPGLLLMVMDACRSIGDFSIVDAAAQDTVLKGAPATRPMHDARINLLAAYASRPGMPAIASDAGGDGPSLFTAELLAQLGMDEREFGVMFNDVSAQVRLASGERQQPGLQDWSDTELYLRLPTALREQQKEAWLVALSSRSRKLIQRFAYRFSISRHAAAARAWLADNVFEDPAANPIHPRELAAFPANAGARNLRSNLFASARPADRRALLLELRVPPLPDGLPELLHGAAIKRALANLRDSPRRITQVALAIEPSADPNESDVREARLQHAIFLLERGGLDRGQLVRTTEGDEAHAAIGNHSRSRIGDGVRLRFFGRLLSVALLMTMGAATHAAIAAHPYDEAIARHARHETSKIVGGIEASDAQVPWQVSLGVASIPDPRAAHFCGGSVIAATWIVTAAHCVARLAPDKVRVVAGSNTLQPGLPRHVVKRIIVHPSFAPATVDRDIALLELAEPLPMDDRIQAIALLRTGQEKKRLVKDAALAVTGWGVTVEDGVAVGSLRVLDVPLVLRRSCNRALAYDGAISINMICAGYPTGGRDACQGDSGGPLTVDLDIDGKRTPTLAGIVSWGDGCAHVDKVGVYTRVAKFTAWVGACLAGGPGCR